jgi:hypothetical protein
MSASSKLRIKRGSGPSGKLRAHNLRKRALPYLLKDFEQRCAYSMRHVEFAGGERHMEIDHFDPTLSGLARHAYSNLMLATRHCNNMKRDAWPTATQRASGCRLLNPTKEIDYGVHIFEDPDSGQLVGATPAGQYHIDMLDLNHETFVWERRKRAQYRHLRDNAPATLAGSFEQVRELIDFVGEQIDRLIPPIAPPPKAGSHPSEGLN